MYREGVSEPAAKRVGLTSCFCCQQHYFLHWPKSDSASSGNIFSFLPSLASPCVCLAFIPPTLPPHLLLLSILSLFLAVADSWRHYERLLEWQPVVEEEQTPNVQEEEEEEVREHKKKNKQMWHHSLSCGQTCIYLCTKMHTWTWMHHPLRFARKKNNNNNNNTWQKYFPLPLLLKICVSYFCILKSRLKLLCKHNFTLICFQRCIWFHVRCVKPRRIPSDSVQNVWPHSVFNNNDLKFWKTQLHNHMNVLWLSF